MGERISDLKGTIGMMQSADYKERFKAEYAQLAIRSQKLEEFLRKYKNGELDFKPNCTYELLHEQLVYMKNYLSVLDERAKVENVDVENL